MDFLTILVVAIALALDAFAVSITCGLKLQTFRLNKFLKIAFSFGGVQALMPCLGWFFGSFLTSFLLSYASYLAFGVFFFLGCKTIYDQIQRKTRKNCALCNCSGFKCLFWLAIATSIDAFLVGVAFAAQEISLVLSVLIIGTVTFVLSLVGCYLGISSSQFLDKKAGYAASILLFLVAFKVLLT